MSLEACMAADDIESRKLKHKFSDINRKGRDEPNVKNLIFLDFILINKLSNFLTMQSLMMGGHSSLLLLSFCLRTKNALSLSMLQRIY